MRDAERFSSTRWLLAYTLSLLTTPMMLMPFSPGTQTFLYALIVVLGTNVVVGALLSHAFIRRWRVLATWEFKLSIAALVTTTTSLLGLCASLLGA